MEPSAVLPHSSVARAAGRTLSQRFRYGSGIPAEHIKGQEQETSHRCADGVPGPCRDASQGGEGCIPARVQVIQGAAGILQQASEQTLQVQRAFTPCGRCSRMKACGMG